jgi:NAD(P)-dependent dehydrogenase (short-subunit alcohol dehydrogenase family)
MRLQNKVAIITGAANGIGLSIAAAFVQEGAKVLMADIDEIKVNQEATALAKNGAISIGLKCDVGDTTDVKQLIETAIRLFGKIDILVNNAAVAIGGNIVEMPEADWDTVMNINLKSVYRTIKETLPYMLKQRSGSVINISSTQAFRSWHNWTAYAGAKGAMLAMTNQLAGQFGKDNVRFNSISPGAILTPMNAKRAEIEGSAILEKSAAQNAMNRL